MFISQTPVRITLQLNRPHFSTVPLLHLATSCIYTPMLPQIVTNVTLSETKPCYTIEYVGFLLPRTLVKIIILKGGFHPDEVRSDPIFSNTIQLFFLIFGGASLQNTACCWKGLRFTVGVVLYWHRLHGT